MLCVVFIFAVYNVGRERLSNLRSNINGTGFLDANVTQLLSKPNAIKVKIGAYFDNLHDLSLQNRRFVGEGFYWYEWGQDLQDILDKNNIDSGGMISIANQLDTWDSDIQGFDDDVIRLPNGNYYRQLRFSSNLYMPEINLKRFPFETLQLPVVLETYDDNLAIQNGNMILVPDARSNSLVAPAAGINGYRIVDADLVPTIRTLGTD